MMYNDSSSVTGLLLNGDNEILIPLISVLVQFYHEGTTDPIVLTEISVNYRDIYTIGTVFIATSITTDALGQALILMPFGQLIISPNHYVLYTQETDAVVNVNVEMPTYTLLYL